MAKVTQKIPMTPENTNQHKRLAAGQPVDGLTIPGQSRKEPQKGEQKPSGSVKK